MAKPAVPEVDPLIHEPARLRVLVFLAMVEAADFMFVLRRTGMSRGNLSVQLGRLESAGLVESGKREVNGRLRTTYALTRQGLEALRSYRTTMREILAAIPD